jgi:hypothetical protein
MTTEKKQSDIAEVRDQLSLDFADGEYLNVVGRNLGMDRPILGYTDDTWRALVKTLALEYKQIATKFRDVLAILFGPQITEVGTLAESVLIGDTSFVLNDSSNFPQLGTLVFDEGGGLLLEETLDYCYIDRETNTVYLEESFGAAHVARDSDAEQAVIAISPLDEVVLLHTDHFSITDYPYTLVLGRGTTEEEVVLVSNNDRDTSTLTLTTTPVNTHTTLTASPVSDELAQGYFVSSAFLLLEDATKFPSEGIIRLEASDTFTVTGAGTGPTDRAFDLAASTLIEDGIIGYEIVFDIATTTVALQGVVRRVVANTTTEVTVSEDFSGPGTAPQVGDTFKLFPIVSYSSIDYDDHTVTLSKPLVQTPLDIALNSTVELMKNGSTAALGPVKFVGAGWDVIQSTPRLVELLLPPDIRDLNDIRSASYMHDDRLSVISTTNSAEVTSGDIEAFSLDFSSFPDAGTVEFDPGGGDAERIAYGRVISSLDADAAEGATTLALLSSDDFPLTYPTDVILNEGTSTEETLTVTGNAPNTDILTLSTPLVSDHNAGEVIKSKEKINLEAGVFNTHSIGTTIEFYQPLYVTVPIGDFNQLAATFPGPYMYDPIEPVATATSAVTATTILVPGPTFLSIDQSNGRSALEVEDALGMLESLGVSFDMTLGTGTAAKEEFEVVGVALKNRALTTVSDNSLIGDIGIGLTSYTPGTPSTGGAFPDVNGYRIVIDEANADREVAYVLGHGIVSNATASIGSGVDGTVNITAVGTLEGLAGNSATVEVFDNTPTDGPLTVVESPAGVIAVTLAVAGGTFDDAANTAALVSIAINGLASGDFSAAFSGTGADPLVSDEAVQSFTGGVEGLLLEQPLTIAHTAADTVSLMADVLSVTAVSKTHQGSVSSADRSTSLTGPSAYNPTPRASGAEFVSPWVDSITVLSSTGLDITGGRVLLNFGSGQIPVESTLSAPTSPGAVTAALVSSDDFPSPVSSFTAIIGVGTPKEEAILVTANNTGTDVFTFATPYGLQYAHSTGDIVRWVPGVEEDVTYTEIDGNDLVFSPPIMLQYSHYPAETVIDSSADSDPRDNGYDFPLRMPVDILVRLQYLLDIVRAAGVQVELITQR